MPSPQDADRQFKDASYIVSCADEARNDGKVDEALALYESALKVFTTISTEYPDWERAKLEKQQNYCSSAIVVLRPAMFPPENDTALGPPVEWLNWKTDPVATTNTTISTKSTARQMLMAGLTEEARAFLMGALNNNPDDQEIRLLLGVAQCQARRYNDALFLLEELVKDAPTNALGHVCLGTAYFGLNRLVDAADAMKDALALDPTLSEAHYNLAQILLRRDPPDIPGATQHYRRAVELGGKVDRDLQRRLKAEVADTL